MAKEKKVKETPWTEQRILHKYDDDDVLMTDVYRKFGWQTWKRMTEPERAMWAPMSAATPAPISKEVIEFNKTQSIEASDEEVSKHKDKTRELGDKMLSEQAEEAFAPQSTLKLSEIDILRAKLRERGIKFAYNSKLPTLQKKLADADNPE